MLDRKDFLKACAAAMCAPGVCGAAAAAETAKACDPKALDAAGGTIDAARMRFAKMVEEIGKLPDGQGKALFNAMGRNCAKTCCPGLIERFRGDLNGFLKTAQSIWMAEAHYDEAAGVLDIADKPGCTCPLAKIGTTPGALCDCSLGWQEEAYSTILGRPVKAELKESILRGGKRCAFKITVI